MAHEAVWFSRPRGYGKGSRSWYATVHISPLEGEKAYEEDVLEQRAANKSCTAEFAHTKLVLSESTA
jgi:hypothetical protein